MNIHKLLKELVFDNDLTQLLISKITDVNKLDKNGNTYLHIGIKHGHSLDTINKIIEIGCDYNLINNDGLTMFETYFYYGDIQILEQITALMIKLNIKFTQRILINYCCRLSKKNPDNNICKFMINQINELNLEQIVDQIINDKYLQNEDIPANQRMIIQMIKIFDELNITYVKQNIFQNILKRYLLNTSADMIDNFILHNIKIDFSMIELLFQQYNIDDASQRTIIKKILSTDYKLTHDELYKCGTMMIKMNTKSKNNSLLLFWPDAEYTKYLLFNIIIEKNKDLFDGEEINEGTSELIKKIMRFCYDEINFCSGYFIIASVYNVCSFSYREEKNRPWAIFCLFRSRIEIINLEKISEENIKLKKENDFYKLHLENNPDGKLVKDYCEHFNSLI